MKRLFTALLLWALAAGGVRAAVPNCVRGVAEALPSREVEILLNVGREYDLRDDMLKLLLTIRRIESGGSGIEMGVASNFPRHRAPARAAIPEALTRACVSKHSGRRERSGSTTPAIWTHSRGAIVRPGLNTGREWPDAGWRKTNARVTDNPEGRDSRGEGAG